MQRFSSMLQQGPDTKTAAHVRHMQHMGVRLH